MTDFSHQQNAEKFAQAVKDGNIRFGRVASSGAMGQSIQVRQDSGEMVRAIAQNNCTPGEPCTLFFLGNEVRAYGSNDVGTIERSLRYRRHRERENPIVEIEMAIAIYSKQAVAGIIVYEKPIATGITLYERDIKYFGDLVLYTRIQKAVWRGGGACPINPPPPPPGPPAPPPPPPPPPLRPPYTQCERFYRQVFKDGNLVSLPPTFKAANEAFGSPEYPPYIWETPYTSYNVEFGVQGYGFSRKISRQKLAADPGLLTWVSDYNKAIGRGDSATAGALRRLLDRACDLTIHTGGQYWIPSGNPPSYMNSFVRSPPPPPGGAWQLLSERCYEVRDTYVPSTDTGSSTDDPGDEPNGDTYTRIISIAGPHLPIELLRMKMSEAFSIEWSIANNSPDDAEWYFKIHYGTRSTGGWCSTRYIYLKNFRIVESTDYLPPGPLLPANQEVPIIEFKDLNSTSLLSVSTLNYRLRTTSQKLNVKYQKPGGRQVVEETCMYTTNIPATENDYEVRRHIGVWVPSRLRPRF